MAFFYGLSIQCFEMLPGILDPSFSYHYHCVPFLHPYSFCAYGPYYMVVQSVTQTHLYRKNHHVLR